MYPLQQIVFIMILLYFLRYFSIINLNTQKNDLYTKIGQDVEKWQKFRFRLLKLFTSTWLTISFVIGSYLTLSMIFFIILAAWQPSGSFLCQFDTLLVIKTVHNAQLIVIYALTLICLLGDVVSNWYLLFRQCKWFTYIFKNDPYWFRAQIVLFIPFMIYSLVVEIYTLAATTKYLGVVTKFQELIALNTTQALILFLIDVIFPLVITIIESIRSCARKKPAKNALIAVLHDKESNELLVEFSQLEFSIENLACYHDIQQFKKTKANAVQIHAKYLNGSDSVMEVNCQKKSCQVILEKIKFGEVDEELFAQIEQDVLVNLADTYSRFITWDKYVSHTKNKSTQLELIEGTKS
jgi:hypothetical protein